MLRQWVVSLELFEFVTEKTLDIVVGIILAEVKGNEIDGRLLQSSHDVYFRVTCDENTEWSLEAFCGCCSSSEDVGLNFIIGTFIKAIDDDKARVHPAENQ